MPAVSPGRRAALQVLRATGRGQRLDRALNDGLPGIPERERAWVHELTYGVMRLRGRLDHVLDHHLHAGADSVSPLLLDLLRSGAYQLLCMDGVPAYAAISETVEQAKGEAGRGTAGLVNAVLRSVQRGGLDAQDFPDPGSDPTGHLSTWGSHPTWMVERWLDRWSFDDVSTLVELDNRPPRLSIRPIGLTVEEAVRRLRESGVESVRVGRATGCLWIEGGADPRRVLERVPAVVQDPAAALVVAYAAPGSDDVVADLCAAPGGKTLALASSASYVLAGDASVGRLALVRENVERLGPRVSAVGTVVARAELPPLSRADLVLVDVPCTGTGTLRRHPDAKWRLVPGDVGRLAALQDEILAGAAGVVRPGGSLVYSTCTLEPEENEERVLKFLKDHEDFRIDVAEAAPAEWIDDRGFLRVMPQESGFDGAFAARMRRVG